MKDTPHIRDIDLDRLEWECVKHGRQVEKAYEKLAQAKFELEVAETKLEVIQADLSVKIRKKPARYGLKSATEVAIKNLIVLQEEYKKQKWQCLRLKHKVGIFQGRCTALEHKKRNITDAISLWSFSYYARPRVEKEANEKFDMARKRTIRGDD